MCGSFCLLALSSAGEIKLHEVEIRWVTLPYLNTYLLYLPKLLGCFSSVLLVVDHLYWGPVQSVFLHLAESGQAAYSGLFRFHPAASAFCHISSKHLWPSDIKSTAFPCHAFASMCFAHVVASDQKLFKAFTILFSSCYSGTGLSLCHLSKQYTFWTFYSWQGPILHYNSRGSSMVCTPLWVL